MKFQIENINSNPVILMRRAGYIFQRHSAENEQSYILPMGRNGYPRFHAYITKQGSTLEVSIHIDHTKHTHGDMTRHGGEYDDSGALGPEVERLKKFLK